jgi:hypothetical protein
VNDWRDESNVVGVAENSIVRHNPLSPTPYNVYREAGPPAQGGNGTGVGAAAALAHPWVWVLVILGLVAWVIYLLFTRMIVPFVRWIFNVEPTPPPLPVPTQVDTRCDERQQWEITRRAELRAEVKNWLP